MYIWGTANILKSQGQGERPLAKLHLHPLAQFCPGQEWAQSRKSTGKVKPILTLSRIRQESDLCMCVFLNHI